MVQSLSMNIDLISKILGEKVTRNSDSSALIFALLSKESPLSIAEIERGVYRHFKAKKTYQAIRKAVQKLESVSILASTSNGYEINKKWLLNVKDSIDGLIAEQQGDNFGVLREKLGPQTFASYQFNSLFTLDNFWGDIAIDCCKDLGKTKGLKYISISHYAWWMIINLGKETQFWKTISKFGMQSELILQKQIPLNNWASRIYKHIGLKIKMKNLDRFDDSLCYNLAGELVIQVKMSEKATKKVRNFFSSYKSFDDVAVEDIEALAHQSFDLRLSIYKDIALANNIKMAYGLN